MLNEIEKILKDSKALLNGHFMLSSGLHSDTYIQCALVLKSPKRAEYLGRLLGENLRSEVKKEADFIIAPAMGGIIIGHEVARALGKDFLFTERVDGNMIFRRGFGLPENSNVFVIEDVFTTGKSTREVIELLKSEKVNILGCGSIVDRSGGTVNFDVPKVSLITFDVKNYKSEQCPLCKAGIKIEKPGSRLNF